jgi:DNA-binding beta-propeller fold protein YncE
MINPTAGTFNTPILVADKVQFPGGSSDSTPELTVVNGEVVSAAFEIKSTTGGLLIPRMTKSERNEMNVDNGMIIYNLTESAFDMFSNGSWKIVTGGAILPTTPNNVAVFDDTVGTIRDSGVPIAPRVPPFALAMAPDSNLEISNLGYVQFAGTSGYAFLGDQAAVQLFSQPSPQNVCVVVTDGSIPPSPSSESCAFEINTRFGALLISRMTTANMNSLVNAQDGMMLYNSTLLKFQGRQNSMWGDIHTSVGPILARITNVSDNYNLSPGANAVMVNAPALSPIMVLPSNPPIGLTYQIFDSSGMASDTYPIRIDGNGKTVNGINTGPNLLTTVPVGSNPFGLSATPSGNVYCINLLGNSVSIYNGVTLVTTIGGLNQPQALAISPDGSIALIANGGVGANSVTAIQRASNIAPSPLPIFLRNIGTGNTPLSLAYTGNGLYAYVGNSASNSLTVIQNASTNPTFFSNISHASFATPFKTLIYPDSLGNLLFILNRGSTNVVSCFFNASNGNPLFNGTMVSVDSGAIWADMYFGNNNIWVSTSQGNIDIFDIGTRNLVKRFVISFSPDSRVYFTPSGNYVYSIHNNSSILRIYTDVGTTNPVLLKTIDIGSGLTATSMTFSANGYYAYVVNGSAPASVSVIQNASGGDPTLYVSIPVGTDPSDIVSTNDGNFAYVSNRGSDNMTVIQNASGYKYINSNYGAAYLIYNGTQWNGIKWSST